MNNGSRISPALIATCATLLVAMTPTAPAHAQQKTPLTEHYVLDRFRILYATEGVSAIPPDDVDQNGVPDRVENVAKQLWAAHHLFCEVLEFPDPFNSERYEGVTCFQVSLRDTSEINGVNGVAFESAQRAVRIPEGKPDDRALVAAIAVHVDPIKNVTPAHEFFHLIQYSASYFKASWYLEGQARWAEHGIAKDGIGEVKYAPSGPWPQRLQHLAQLPDMGSKCETVLWNPIAMRTDRDGLLTDEKLGPELAGLHYSDGSPVLADRLLNGPEVMRDILIELGKQDDVAFKDLGYEDWSEDNQRSKKNYPYIYKAIMDALRKHAPPVGRYEVPSVER